MGNSNNFMGNGKLPVNMPAPADAWQDMRARLDEEMPVGAALPLPGSGIINVDNTVFRSVTLLFLLLLLSCPVLFFTGKNAGGNKAAARLTPTAGQHNVKPADAVNDEENKNNQPQVIAGTTATNNKPANDNDKANTAAIKNGSANKMAQHKKFYTQTIPQHITQAIPAAGDSNMVDNAIASPVAQAAGKPAFNDTTTQQPAKKQSLQSTGKTAIAAGDDDDKKGESDDEKTQWQAGVWWKAQVPFSGFKHYADGANGKSQPYRLLIPGVWVAMQNDRDMLDAELNIFASTVYKPQQFYGYYSVPAAQITVDEKYKLTKTFGVSLGLGYSRNIGRNWWVGGNVQLTGLTAAANVIDSTITTGNVNNITYRSGSGKVKDTLWGDFNKLQVRLGAQLVYKLTNVQAGIRAGIYFISPMSRYNTVHAPLETELFIRWGLWKWKK